MNLLIRAEFDLVWFFNSYPFLIRTNKNFELGRVFKEQKELTIFDIRA